MRYNFIQKRLKYVSTALAYLILVGLFFVNQQVDAQTVKLYDSSLPSSFFGGGFGINDYGLGVCGEAQIRDKVWVYAMAGISEWGQRLSGGLTYYPDKNGYKSSFSAGFSYAFGVQEYKTNLEVEETMWNDSQKREVSLKLFPVRTINLVYAYNLKVGTKSKIVFSTGYAILLTDETFVRNNGRYWNELTDDAVEYIDFLTPGGVIFGIRYMFGT